jgi:hypothetical protein
MSQKLENIVSSLADKIFLPVDVEYKNYFSVPLKALVILFFIYSSIIALPPIIDLVKDNAFPLPFIDSVYSNPAFWKRWLPFLDFFIEAIFFLMIGGSIFSEWVVAHSKAIIDKYEIAVEAAKTQELAEAKEVLVKSIMNYNMLLKGITIQNLIPRVFEIYKASREVIDLLVNDAARVNARFLATKLAVSFPGGAYGVCAFVLFAALIQVKVAQFYV